MVIPLYIKTKYDLHQVLRSVSFLFFFSFVIVMLLVTCSSM